MHLFVILGKKHSQSNRSTTFIISAQKYHRSLDHLREARIQILNLLLTKIDNDTNMKILHQLILLLVSAISFNLATAWECSRECSGYDECVRENRARGNRELFDGDAMKDDEEQDTDLSEVTPITNLRGSSNATRKLLTFHFQIKMYWERDYCVSFLAWRCCCHGKPTHSHKQHFSSFIFS